MTNHFRFRLGDIEYLRCALPKSSCHELEAGQIYWITDRTPHESIPLEAGTERQFFRIVTSTVSYWYKDHSTENPLGTVGSQLKRGAILRKMTI